jgi:hypothetical protein
MQKTQRAKFTSSRCVLEFDQAWSNDQMDAFLRFHFPTLFQYADMARPIEPGSDKVHWCLINKEGRKFEVVDCSMPDGEMFNRFKGRRAASAKESHIYLGTHKSLYVSL